MAGNRKAAAAMPPANGVIDVTWCPNPLRPVAERQVKRLVLTGTDTVESIVHRLGLHGTSLDASLNSFDVQRRRWGRKRVREGDALVLRQRARGVDPVTATAKFIMEYSFSYEAAVAAAYALAFVTTTATALALTYVANSLMSKGVVGGGGNDAKAALDSYSIEGGSNSMRPYAPLPLVLGEHRIFPDYASRPFAEYVPDPTTTHRVINSTPEYSNETAPAWSYTETYDAGTSTWTVTPDSPWTQIGDAGDGLTFYFGDNQARTYEAPAGGFGGGTGTTTVTMPHTFVIRHTGGVPADDRVTDYESYYADPVSPSPTAWAALGSTLPIVVGYGYEVTDNTEQLTSVFNFGLGDLTLSDFRIGSTPLSNFNQWDQDESAVPAGHPERTQLVGYTSPEYTGTDYPDDVTVVDGGKLEQRDGVINSGWIERTSRASRYVQIDVGGRLFRQGTSDIEALTCDLEAEYRAAGSGVWTAMSFSPVTLSNGSMTVLRRTFAQAFAFDVDSVRVRRVTPEPTEAKDVSELEFTRAKFVRPQVALYPAQKRVGLIIKATGQLNGRIDRFSAFVQAKHWVWNSVAAWTPGVYPEAGAGAWTWTNTINPAWLFLYYARGGFQNSGVSAYMGESGWLDRPDPANGARLFGAGLTNDRIDYASIVAWGQWCQANNLQCRMVVDEQRNAGDVLDDIAAAGRASKSWATGKLSVVWEAAGQPVVAAFGMSNILAGSFSIGYDTDTQQVHEFALQYTRCDADYQPDTVYATVPGVAQVVNQQAEQAVYSMPQAQAQRLVNLMAASRYYHRRKITWESHLEALSVQRGDIVHLAHDLTQWAFSGRLVALTAAGGAITQARLSCLVENAGGAGSFYLWIRKPDGSFMGVQCTPPAARTDLVDVIGAWSTADAPGLLGGAADPQNLASGWPDTIPEDWMFLAGPAATPGKRVRITSMEPTSGRKVRVTARDEYEEYYPLEYGLGGAPAPADDERLVARAFNLTIDPAPAGGHRLSWELQNAHGAEVTVAVNGGAPAQVPTHGVLSVLGTEVLLPAYPAGTSLAIELLPIAAGTPIAVAGDSMTVEV